MNDLHHQLARFHSRQHVHTQRLLLHRIGKVLGHLIVDVGIKQCTADVLQGLGNIDLGDLALTLQDLKRSLKSVT